MDIGPWGNIEERPWEISLVYRSWNAVVTLPLPCLEISKMMGASMFIAAFVVGLAVRREPRASFTIGPWSHFHLIADAADFSRTKASDG
jgi:hypothetical protein